MTQCVGEVSHVKGVKNTGSPAEWTARHFALLDEQFRSLATIDVARMPYRGAGLAVADSIGGQITMISDASASALAQPPTSIQYRNDREQ